MRASRMRPTDSSRHAYELTAPSSPSSPCSAAETAPVARCPPRDRRRARAQTQRIEPPEHPSRLRSWRCRTRPYAGARSQRAASIEDLSLAVAPSVGMKLTIRIRKRLQPIRRAHPVARSRRCDASVPVSAPTDRRQPPHRIVGTARTVPSTDRVRPSAEAQPAAQHGGDSDRGTAPAGPGTALRPVSA